MKENALGRRLKNRALFIAGLVAILWGVELINLVMDHSLNEWGIRPRSVSGLIGILLCPFLHGSVGHLLMNSLPLLLLGMLVILGSEREFLAISLLIVLLGGAGVWLVGSAKSVHVGASGLIFGYFGFLLARAWFGRDFRSLVFAVLAVFLYGGLFFGLLPQAGPVSWEGHLFGFLAGLLVGRLFTKEPHKK